MEVITIQNDITFNQIKQEQISKVSNSLTDLLNSMKEMERKQLKRLEKERQDEIAIANKKYHEKNPNGIYLIDDVWGVIKSFIDFTPPPPIPLYKHFGLTKYTMFSPNCKYIRIYNRNKISEKMRVYLQSFYSFRSLLNNTLFKILIEFNKYSSTQKTANFSIKFFMSNDENKIHNEDWISNQVMDEHYTRAKCEWKEDDTRDQETCYLRIRNIWGGWEKLNCADFYELPKN